MELEVRTGLDLNLWSPRVDRGAKWLDKRLPGWAEQIDIDNLDMGSSRNCILGQLSPLLVPGTPAYRQNYSIVLRKVRSPLARVFDRLWFSLWEYRHGFDLPYPPAGRMGFNYIAWDDLRNMWIRRINGRL